MELTHSPTGRALAEWLTLPTAAKVPRPVLRGAHPSAVAVVAEQAVVMPTGPLVRAVVVAETQAAGFHPELKPQAFQVKAAAVAADSEPATVLA